MKQTTIRACCTVACAFGVDATIAEESELPFEVHGQATYVRQYKPAMHSPYAGEHSLRGGSSG